MGRSILLGLLLASILPAAQASALPEPVNVLEMPAERDAVPTVRPTDAQLMSLPAAADLMGSTAASAWRPFQVQAPKKSRDCQVAKKFSTKYKTKIACSALYKQTVVWLAPVMEPKASAEPVKAKSKKKPTKRRVVLPKTDPSV